MQVQHETQLFGGTALNPENFASYSSQTLDEYTLAKVNLMPIEHLACCPSENVIASYNYCTNQILVFDTKARSMREKFPLKPCDKKFSKSSFTLKGIDFSPDGTRLAIGQSDCIIYVYKLSSSSSIASATGENQPAQEKLVITGKFVCSSPVVSLIWSDCGLIFATQDGKVKLISVTFKSSNDNTVQSQSASTKVISIYNSPKGSLPLSLAHKSAILAISYNDNTIVITTYSLAIDNPDSSSANEPSTRRVSSTSLALVTLKHSCPAYCLAFVQNNTLCCAGTDGRLTFYAIISENQQRWQDNSISAKLLHNFELKDEVRAIDYSFTNELLAVATENRIVFVKYNQETSNWLLEQSFIELKTSGGGSLCPQLVTCVRWTQDGCQLVAGTLFGTVELFRCSWNKQSINEQLDICHIAKNRVRITDRARNLLATFKTQTDIKRVNLLNNGRSVIVWTSSSLLLARLDQPWAQSEIEWPSRVGRSAKFCFDYSGYVLVYNSISNQMSVIKLGQNDVLYAIKLDGGAKKDTISVRQYPTPVNNQQSNDIQMLSSTRVRSAGSRSRNSSLTVMQEPSKSAFSESSLIERLAYAESSSVGHLLVVVNLKTNDRLLSRSHAEPIDWLELSYTGNYLAFKDSSKRIFLVDLSLSNKQMKTQNFKELASKCEFATWLQDTDILIVQSSHKIYVWYNIDKSEQTRVEIDSRAANIINSPPIMDLSLAKRSYPLVSKVTNEFQLVLSNSQTIQLDKLLIKFYALIMGNHLEAASELLMETQDAKPKASKLNQLWLKLGWICLDQSDLVTAKRAFERLNQISMVAYLDECLKCEDADEVQVRIVKLRGDWDKFEQIADSEQIVETYRRLNKWTRLIDYLSRSQKFRQRDLAEQEYQRWLIGRGYYLRGAQLQAKSGDLHGALELLMSHKRYEEACDLFISEQKSSLANREDATGVVLLNLAKELKTQLIDANNLDKAAQVSERLLGATDEALDLYLRAKAFESALELAKRTGADDERLKSVRLAHADWLMDLYWRERLARRKALPAIELYYLSSRDKCLDAAIELGEYERALVLLRECCDASCSNGDDRLLPSKEPQQQRAAQRIAEWMLAKGRHSDAAEAYKLGRHYDALTELYINQRDYSAAYAASLDLSPRDQVDARFAQLADDRLAQHNDVESAERIYLMLGRPELAIEMHRNKTRDHERMLALIAEHQPDQLESSLLVLAREMETRGDLHLAERYLLRASESEWTSVVRMYRLANEWESAFRVARAHCASERDPLLVQLAYWWCKSLNNAQQAHELLTNKNNTNTEIPANYLSLVVEFCCEHGNYPLAIELTRVDATSGGCGDEQLAHLVKRYAQHLAAQSNLRLAEQVLLEHGLVADAVRMYANNGILSEALRVAEQQLAVAQREESTNNYTHQIDELRNLLNKTLVECAQRLTGQLEGSQSSSFLSSSSSSVLLAKQRGGRAVAAAGAADETGEKLAAIQQLYLRAQRPELAVALYKERGMWQEAIQVAQRFAPQLVEDIERALDEQVAQEVAPILATIPSAATNRRRVSTVVQNGSDPKRP